MPMLKSLNLSRKQKVGLMILFGLGGVVIVVSSLRLHALTEIFGAEGERKFTKPLIDIWSGVEICVGIICACAPVLKAFIKYCKPRLFGTTGSREDQSTGQPAKESWWSQWNVSWYPSRWRQGSDKSDSTRIEEDRHKGRGSVAYDAKRPLVTQTKACFPPPPTAGPSFSDISTVSENVYPARHKYGDSSSTFTISTMPGPGSNNTRPISPSMMGRKNNPADSDVAQEIGARVLRFGPQAPQTRPMSWWSEVSETKSQGWG
ncbi:MAG: hypothetical protein Q9167_003773 [Letrouitia subvulpina]